MPKIPSHLPTLGQTEVFTLAYCATCKRTTVQLIFPERGNAFLCLGHSRKAMTADQIKRAERREREARQPKLFH